MILSYIFKLSFRANKTDPRIQRVEGYEMTSDYIGQNWFKYFKGNDLFFEIKPRSGQSLVADYDFF